MAGAVYEPANRIVTENERGVFVVGARSDDTDDTSYRIYAAPLVCTP